MQGNATDTVSGEALAALRGGIVQGTIGSAPGVQHAYVTGNAAATKDFNDQLSWLPEFSSTACASCSGPAPP